MSGSQRNIILERLKKAPVREVPERPEMPPLAELGMSQEELIEKFIQNLTEQSAVVHRVKAPSDLPNVLTDVIKEESISGMFVSEDPVISTLDVDSRAGSTGILLKKASEFHDSALYKEAVFNGVEAGLTGVDVAVAESGTLVISHSEKNARLISLAPITHIAAVPVKSLVPVFETAMEKILEKGHLPSQLTFITGPSMTADIQATPFKGMHGPKRLIVLLLDY